MSDCRGKAALLSACVAALFLGACGGGGSDRPGGLPTPTPTPIASPTPTPTPTPTPPPTNAFDTPEYRASNSAVTARALAAYDAGATGAGVKVAVVDTGINPNLPEFTGRIDPASQDVAANRGLDDDDGHGSMVSGVIAANRDGVYMHGVAFQASIVSLNVGDPAGCKPGNDCFLDSAIDDAIDLARLSGARIINMSFGDEEGMTADVWPAIQRAVDAGIVIVMAAGNGGTANPNGFALQNISNNGSSGLFIIAGAMDSNRNIASFSDRAGTTAAASWYLTALGVGNATVDELGNRVNVNGTSFATPTIVGAAALLAGAFPNLTGSQIVNLLLTTADDAGAAGTDAIFGRGILNITRAFQPQGSTSLAGSSRVISLADNGSVSGPMGDASSPAGAIILDGYSRAYALNLAQTLRRAPADRPLSAAIAGGNYRTASGGGGPVALAITLRQDEADAGRLALERYQLGPDDRRAAKAVAALAIGKLTPRTSVALGFSQSGRALQQRLARHADSAFLVARDPMARAGFHPAGNSSVAVRQELGPLGLTVTAERGRVDDPRRTPRPHLPGYAVQSLTLDRSAGPVDLSLGAARLAEEETVLGARFASLFTESGSRTWLADASATARLGSGWRASAAYRRGWTWVGDSGGLVDRGRMMSEAYSIDLTKRGLLSSGDRLALRVMQPLRIVRGGFELTVPIRYDHASASTTYGPSAFNLSPSGRERDIELAYGTGFLGGAIDFHAFVRTDPGHVRRTRDDVGAAIRFTFRP